MRKLATLGVAALTVLTLAGCSSTGASDSSSKSSNSSSKTAQSTEGVTKAKFDAITIGENVGTSLADVKKSFGKDPNLTSSSTIQNVKTDLNTWKNVAGGDITSTVAIGFANDHAVSKAITGIKVNRSKKITLEQFNAISNGMSQDEVKKQLGDPNGYDISKVAGYSAEVWTYTSGVQGDMGANCGITFNNGTVSSKTQLNMK